MGHKSPKPAKTPALAGALPPKGGAPESDGDSRRRTGGTRGVPGASPKASGAAGVKGYGRLEAPAPGPLAFTDEEDRAMKRQGFAIFAVDELGEPPYQVLRLDEAPEFLGEDEPWVQPFASDREAKEHVRGRCDQQDPLALKIREFLRLESPEEFNDVFLPVAAGKTGTGPEGVHRFATIQEAEGYIAKVEKTDPVGVHRGDYYIDVPEDMP